MKLLVLDIEGTLFQTHIRLPGTTINSTIWQGIAHRLGEGAIAEEVATHGKWSRGEYRNYLEWMKDTILIHKKYGLTKSIFNEVIESAQYCHGVEKTLRNLDRNLFEPVLISGGFRELAKRAQQDLDIIHAFAACEYFFGADDLLTSFNLLPCDFNGKIDFIQLMLREYGLGQEDWVFVGDGANDVPIAKVAPLSIGFQAHSHLKEVVTFSIDNFENLTSLIGIAK